jgi:hypothetical protein
MATTKIIPGVLDLNESASESGLKIPSGTELNRPATDVTGMVRNNTNETSGFSASCEEYYNGTEWKKLTVVDNSAPFVAMNADGNIEDINGNITTVSATTPATRNIEYNPNTGKYYYVAYNVTPNAISSATPFNGSSWSNDNLVTSTDRTNYLHYDTASGWMFRTMTTGDPGRLNPAGDTFTTSWSQLQRNTAFAFDGTNYGVVTRDVSTTVGLYYSSNPANSSWTTNTNIAQDLYWCASSGSGNVILIDDDANTLYYSSNGFNSSSFSTYTPPWSDIRQPIYYVNNKWFCINTGSNKLWYSSAALPSSSSDWSEVSYPSGQSFATSLTNNIVMSPRYRSVNSTYYITSGNTSNNYWTSTDGINWTAQDTGSGKYIIIANFI